MPQKFKKILSLLCLLGFVTCAHAEFDLRYDFYGLQPNLAKNVEARLLATLQKFTNLSLNEIKNDYQQSPTIIQQAIAPFGYLRPTIKTKLLRVKKIYYIKVWVDPGKGLPIRKVNIVIQGTAKNDPRIKKFLSQQSIKVDSTFSAQAYENLKQKILSIAKDDGYLMAKITDSNVNINTINYFADISLKIQSGPRFRFGAINFSKTPFSEQFLRRYLTFKPHDYYSSNKIQALQQDLTNSDYFNFVDVSPNLAYKKQHIVPVKINLRPRKRIQYLFGAGYGTDTGIRGLTSIEIRRVTTLGQRLKTQIRASEKSSNLSATYIIPGPNPVVNQFNINASGERTNDASGESTLALVGASYLTKIFGWQQTLSLSLQHENYQIEDQPSQSSLLLVPSISWLKVVAHDPIRPKNGYRIYTLIQGASKATIGTTNFFQVETSAKWIHTYFRNWRSVLRGKFGYNSVKNLNTLPLSFQFFTGGAQSVRGYTYNGIGPGRILIVASAELQRRVYKNWYLAGFFDAGKSSSSLQSPFKKGVGAGIVWLSPIGAIELDLTKALNQAGEPYLVQFSMGPEL